MRSFVTDYVEFFEKNKKYEVCNNIGTQKIFEKIYSEEGIAAMLTSIHSNRPAVEGLTEILTSYVNQGYNLDDQWKKCVGAWVAFLLQPFGYIKGSSKKITSEQSIFSSGACYMQTNEAKYKLITKYEIIENF